MAFRPITPNTGPVRKVLVSEKNGLHHSSAMNTPRGAASSSSSSSRGHLTNLHGRAGISSSASAASSANAAAAAAAQQQQQEEELAKQFLLQTQMDVLERELRNTLLRSEQMRRKVHAQCDSQARLVVDNEEWMGTKASQRAAKQAVYDQEQTDATKALEAMQSAQSVAEEKASAAAALANESMRRRDEAKEQLTMMTNSVDNRTKLIALESTKQLDVKKQLAVVEAEIAVLEQKKREQIERMDELKAKVESTRQLERNALEDLEQRKQVLETLQKNIDALKRIRKGH